MEDFAKLLQVFVNANPGTWAVLLLPLLYIGNKIWLSIKSDTRVDKQADQIAQGNDRLIKTLQAEVARYAKDISDFRTQIDALQEDRIRLSTKNRLLELELENLRAQLGLPSTPSPIILAAPEEN